MEKKSEIPPKYLLVSSNALNDFIIPARSYVLYKQWYAQFHHPFLSIADHWQIGEIKEKPGSVIGIQNIEQ